MECTAAERELIERVVEWASIPNDEPPRGRGFFWMFRKSEPSALEISRLTARSAFIAAGKAVVAERS